MLSLLILLSTIVLLLSICGIIYPFRPFRKRRRAAYSLLGSFAALFVFAGLLPEDFTSNATDVEEVAAAATPEVREPSAPKISHGTEETDSSMSKKESVAETDPNIPATPTADEIASTKEKIQLHQFQEARYTVTRWKGRKLDVSTAYAELEALTLSVVRPLPASEIEGNLGGYALLAELNPTEASYIQKIAEYSKKKEDARLASVRRLNKSFDRVDGITWYRHPNNPKYLNSRSTVYLYIGQKDSGRPWLRMKVQYTADTWLFVESVEAWHDGIKEPLIYGRFQTDSNASIWEWQDVSPDEYQLLVLESLGKANEAILRFNGRQYRRDVTLSGSDKRAIIETLEAYRTLSQSR